MCCGNYGHLRKCTACFCWLIGAVCCASVLFFVVVFGGAMCCASVLVFGVDVWEAFAVWSSCVCPVLHVLSWLS